jgi:putative membrane protein
MKGISVALLSVGLFTLPLFAKPKAKEAGKAAMTDQEFVNFAAQTDMTEANLGLAAQDKGNQAVKEYGQMLRTDHTNDYSQLNAAAQKAGLTVPRGTDAEHHRLIVSLDRLKGAAFDRHFAHDMIIGHEHAISVYKKEEQNAQSPDIKTYAQQALPTLQKHLDDARKLEQPGRQSL